MSSPACSEPRVRQAGLADVALLAPLFDGYRQFYGQAPDLVAAEAFLRQRLAAGESIVFVAEDDAGAALGLAQLYPGFSSISLARMYVLNDLFVAPAARGRGIARLLLHASADFGRAAGAGYLELSTAHDNRRAQALYESMGWQREQHFYHYELALA